MLQNDHQWKCNQNSDHRHRGARNRTCGSSVGSWRRRQAKVLSIDGSKEENDEEEKGWEGWHGEEETETVMENWKFWKVGKWRKELRKLFIGIKEVEENVDTWQANKGLKCEGGTCGSLKLCVLTRLFKPVSSVIGVTTQLWAPVKLDFLCAVQSC